MATAGARRALEAPYAIGRAVQAAEKSPSHASRTQERSEGYRREAGTGQSKREEGGYVTMRLVSEVKRAAAGLRRLGARQRRSQETIEFASSLWQLSAPHENSWTCDPTQVGVPPVPPVPPAPRVPPVHHGPQGSHRPDPPPPYSRTKK